MIAVDVQRFLIKQKWSFICRSYMSGVVSQQSTASWHWSFTRIYMNVPAVMGFRRTKWKKTEIQHDMGDISLAETQRLRYHPYSHSHITIIIFIIIIC